MEKKHGLIFTKAACTLLCTLMITLGLASTTYAQTDKDTNNSAGFHLSNTG